MRIQVADPELASSLERVVRHWSATSSDRPRRPVVVTDSVPSRGDTVGGAVHSPVVVLVVDRTPVAAREALEAVLVAGIAGVVRADHVEELSAVLDALDTEMAPVPLDLIVDARAVPDLTEEQLALLAGLLAGSSNRAAGEELGMSLSAVKRQVRSLFDAFDVDDRVQLAVAASRLGFRADPR